MADRKISDLTALTTPAAGDYLPIVDISEPSNASKNKRITIEELLRGAPDGTAAAPSIAFESDPDSGIYSAGANQVAISTNGTGRLFVDAGGRVLVGANSSISAGIATGAIQINNPGPSALTITRWSANAFSPFIVLAKSRGASVGAYSPLLNGDSLGEIQFAGDDGTDLLTVGATIRAVATGDAASNNLPTALVFATTAVSSQVERLRITSDGKVGLGTSSPDTNLEIALSGSSANGLLLSSDNADTSARLFFQNATAGEGYVILQENGGLDFRSGATAGTSSGTQRVRIDSSGNFYVGGSQNAFVAGPGNSLDKWITLQSQDATTTQGFWLLNQDATFRRRGSFAIDPVNNTVGIYTQCSSGAVPPITFTQGTFERARIDSSGRLLVGTSTSTNNTRLEQKLAIVSTGSSGTTYAGLGITTYPGTNAGNASFIDLNRSRGTTDGSMTAVASGDSLGYIVFRGADGTNFINGAQIIGEVDGTPGANDMPGRLVFSTTADGAANSTERMRITSDAYIRLASGTGGIQFNGDTAAANALDDYEEGTWTPALDFGGGSTGITYDARAGYYIKIGKQVFVTVYFNLSNKGTDTGDARITGLPFTSEDFNITGTTSWPGNIPARRQNETSTNFAMLVTDNTANIKCTNGAGVAVTDTTFTNDTIIECSLSYRAA